MSFVCDDRHTCVHCFADRLPSGCDRWAVVLSLVFARGRAGVFAVTRQHPALRMLRLFTPHVYLCVSCVRVFVLLCSCRWLMCMFVFRPPLQAYRYTDGCYGTQVLNASVAQFDGGKQPYPIYSNCSFVMAPLAYTPGKWLTLAFPNAFLSSYQAVHSPQVCSLNLTVCSWLCTRVTHPSCLRSTTAHRRRGPATPFGTRARRCGSCLRHPAPQHRPTAGSHPMQ